METELKTIFTTVSELDASLRDNYNVDLKYSNFFSFLSICVYQNLQFKILY